MNSYAICGLKKNESTVQIKELTMNWFDIKDKSEQSFTILTRFETFILPNWLRCSLKLVYNNAPKTDHNDQPERNQTTAKVYPSGDQEISETGPTSSVVSKMKSKKSAVNVWQLWESKLAQFNFLICMTMYRLKKC